MANFGLSISDGDLKYTAPDGTVIDIAEGVCPLFVTVTDTDDDGVAVDKTGKEIYTAISNKIPVYVYYEGMGAMTLGAVWDDDPLNEFEAGADLYFDYFESFDEGLLHAIYVYLEGDTAEIKNQYYDLSTLIDT